MIETHAPRTQQILVVDDHPLMRVGVCSIINSQPDMKVIGQAATEEEAVRSFISCRPDLTLMDLRLSQGTGLEAIRRIRSVDANARIVVLTTYEGDEDIHQALTAGAKGYLIKGLSSDELVRALRNVAAGQRFIPRIVSTALSSRTPSCTLTPRELQVLQLIFRGMSNREIAIEIQVGEATVKTYVSIILTKLNVDDRTQAVVEALKRGLVHL
jgi:DNA-binding NarL/FixJ family response regulator